MIQSDVCTGLPEGPSYHVCPAFRHSTSDAISEGQKGRNRCLGIAAIWPFMRGQHLQDCRWTPHVHNESLVEGLKDSRGCLPILFNQRSFKDRPISLGFCRFSGKKDSWKEWSRG